LETVSISFGATSVNLCVCCFWSIQFSLSRVELTFVTSFSRLALAAFGV